VRATQEVFVTGVSWVLIVGAVVGGAVVLWFADALAALEAPVGRADPTTCACCRHDEVAHRHEVDGCACTQCPCPAFRHR
jgi:hypothetical protein